MRIVPVWLLFVVAPVLALVASWLRTRRSRSGPGATPVPAVSAHHRGDSGPAPSGWACARARDADPPHEAGALHRQPSAPNPRQGPCRPAEQGPCRPAEQGPYPPSERGIHPPAQQALHPPAEQAPYQPAGPGPCLPVGANNAAKAGLRRNAAGHRLSAAPPDRRRVTGPTVRVTQP